MTNHYDPQDIVRRGNVIYAGPLKLASYTVRDPETGEHGPVQFHMTYDNMVMALMGTSSAQLFAQFVQDTVGTPYRDEVAKLRDRAEKAEDLLRSFSSGMDLEDAADGVTVLDVWLKQVRDHLATVPA